MGWLFGWETKEELVAHLKSSNEIEQASLVGNDLWMIHRGGEPCIILCKLSGKGSGFNKWGYKDMSETMHPYTYNCPLKLLALCPCPDSDDARQWREKVKSYHARQTDRKAMVKTIEVGDVVRLPEGFRPNYFVVHSLKPLSGLAGGQRYRIPKKHIASVEKGV